MHSHRTRVSGLTDCVLMLILMCSGPVFAQAAGTSSSGISSPAKVVVDPRVELLSLIFRLAGNPEYSQGRVVKSDSKPSIVGGVCATFCQASRG